MDTRNEHVVLVSALELCYGDRQWLYVGDVLECSSRGELTASEVLDHVKNDTCVMWSAELTIEGMNYLVDNLNGKMPIVLSDLPVDCLQYR